MLMATGIIAVVVLFCAASVCCRESSVVRQCCKSVVEPANVLDVYSTVDPFRLEHPVDIKTPTTGLDWENDKLTRINWKHANFKAFSVRTAYQWHASDNLLEFFPKKHVFQRADHQHGRAPVNVTVQCNRPLGPPFVKRQDKHSSIYYEVVIGEYTTPGVFRPGGEEGADVIDKEGWEYENTWFSLGWATRPHPPHHMLGDADFSVGIHSNGNLVTSGDVPGGKGADPIVLVKGGLRQGDVVGCGIRYTDLEPDEYDTETDDEDDWDVDDELAEGLVGDRTLGLEEETPTALKARSSGKVTPYGASSGSDSGAGAAASHEVVAIAAGDLSSDDEAEAEPDNGDSGAAGAGESKSNPRSFTNASAVVPLSESSRVESWRVHNVGVRRRRKTKTAVEGVRFFFTLNGDELPRLPKGVASFTWTSIEKYNMGDRRGLLPRGDMRLLALGCAFPTVSCHCHTPVAAYFRLSPPYKWADPTHPHSIELANKVAAEAAAKAKAKLEAMQAERELERERRRQRRSDLGLAGRIAENGGNYHVVSSALGRVDATGAPQAWHEAVDFGDGYAAASDSPVSPLASLAHTAPLRRGKLTPIVKKNGGGSDRSGPRAPRRLMALQQGKDLASTFDASDLSGGSSGGYSSGGVEPGAVLGRLPGRLSAAQAPRYSAAEQRRRSTGTYGRNVRGLGKTALARAAVTRGGRGRGAGAGSGRRSGARRSAGGAIPKRSRGASRKSRASDASNGSGAGGRSPSRSARKSSVAPSSKERRQYDYSGEQ